MVAHKALATVLFTSALLLSACSTGSPSDAEASAETGYASAISATPSISATALVAGEEETPSSPASLETPSAVPSTSLAASPSPENTSLVVSGPITQKGVSCGSVSNDKALILAAAPAGLSCETAQKVMSAAIDRQVMADTDIYGFTCRGRDAATALLDGRSITCTSGETRLEAMENYTLAGIPVTATADYPTLFGSIQVYGFRANGVDCYFGKVGGVSCWRPSVVNSLPYEDVSLSPSTGVKLEAVADLQDPGQVLTDKRELGAGEVITSHGISCSNDGTWTSCRAGEHWFKVNASQLQNS